MESKQLLKLDGSDSEEFKEFELPPARSRRPRMRKALAEAKASGGGRSICSFRSCVLFVTSAVLCGAVLIMGWMLMNIEKDLQDMKEQIRLVKSDEQSDLEHSKNIQTSMSKKLVSLAKDEKEIAELKMKVKILSLQVKKLNSTISELQSQKDSSAAPPNINEDLALLKKGMADTGVDIKKLSDENEATEKTVTLLSKLVRSLKKDVSELKDTSSSVDNESAAKEPVDALPPMVATTSPADKAQDSKRSLKKLSALMKKLVDGYGELFSNKTKKLKLELLHLKKDVLALNNTAKLKFIALENTVNMLQNVTSIQGAELHSAVAKLSDKSFDAENKTSDGKVLSIVKGILISLKSQQSITSNLTRRVAGMEQLVSENVFQKREDSVNSVSDGKSKPHTAEKLQTEAPDQSKQTTEKLTAKSTSKSDVPLTTSQPMKVKSSKDVEAKVSSPLAMTDSTTTTAPSLKSTESEVASTTILPPTLQVENVTMQVEPHDKSKLNMTNVRLMTTVEPSSQKVMNATRRKKTHTDKTGSDESPQTTKKTDLKQLVDATSTRKPKPDIPNVKATTKSIDGLEVLDGGDQSSDSTTNMAENRSQKRHKLSTPSDPDMGPDGDAFANDFSPSEEWEENDRSHSMHLDEFPSNGRSKHETSDQSDGFDALDRLDDSV